MSDSVSTVEYRDIPGWPGYRVGNDGSVWSCRQCKTTPVAWKRLAAAISPAGYRRVTLRNGKSGLQIHVHVLVLTEFVGKRPDGCVTRHLNGDPTDNRVVNLAWGTQLENAQDMVRHGTAKNKPGEKHWCAKLTAAQVADIRSRVGQTRKSIAAEFGMSKSQIQSILTGGNWK